MTMIINFIKYIMLAIEKWAFIAFSDKKYFWDPINIMKMRSF